MERNQVDKAHIEDTKNELFSKGQPCFRTSPLAKRYGWGIHFDENSKTSLYGCETDRYRNMASDKSLTHLKAMKSKKNSVTDIMAFEIGIINKTPLKLKQNDSLAVFVLMLKLVVNIGFEARIILFNTKTKTPVQEIRNGYF